MYLPSHFTETRPDELRRLMREHPLGALVVHGKHGLDADHLPFEYEAHDDGPGRLIAHVARSNPLWRVVPSGSDVMVIFRGVEGYISPNWYPGKAQTHRHVPTWNYEVVHVHGRLAIRDDEKFVRGVVARLTRSHEAAEPRPWRMGDAPKDYLAEMVAAIVGIEIQITRMVGKSKLGQNRDPRDVDGAIAALQARGREPLAAAMARAKGGAPAGPSAGGPVPPSDATSAADGR